MQHCFCTTAIIKFVKSLNIDYDVWVHNWELQGNKGHPSRYDKIMAVAVPIICHHAATRCSDGEKRDWVTVAM